MVGVIEGPSLRTLTFFGELWRAQRFNLQVQIKEANCQSAKHKPLKTKFWRQGF